MTEPLLVVDVQRCFVSSNTRHIPAMAAELLASRVHGPLLFTRLVYAPDSPFRRRLEWHERLSESGALFIYGVEALANSGRVLVKLAHDGASDELREHLREASSENLSMIEIAAPEAPDS